MLQMRIFSVAFLLFSTLTSVGSVGRMGTPTPTLGGELRTTPRQYQENTEPGHASPSHLSLSVYWGLHRARLLVPLCPSEFPSQSRSRSSHSTHTTHTRCRVRWSAAPGWSLLWEADDGLLRAQRSTTCTFRTSRLYTSPTSAGEHLALR